MYFWLCRGVIPCHFNLFDRLTSDDLISNVILWFLHNEPIIVGILFSHTIKMHEMEKEIGHVDNSITGKIHSFPSKKNSFENREEEKIPKKLI